MNPRLRTSIVFLLSTVIFPFVVNAQKKSGLSEEQLKTWWQKDIDQDTIPGISLERAYREILKDKKGKEVVVAVLDTKLDIFHEDIKDQLWVNADEIADNGIDDDNNGYVDDTNGWNFLGNSAGEDVVYQKSEATRILKYYSDKYDSLKEADVSPDLTDEYALYQKAKKIQEANISELNENIQYVDSVLIVFTRAKDTVTQLLSKIDFTSQEVDSLAKSRPDIKDDLEYLSLMMGYDITKEIFHERRERLASYLTTIYALDYDDRAILKDYQHSLADVRYGNNILFNNNLDFQHSTPVSGLMAATRNNGIGTDGISNNIIIMPVVMVAEGDEYDKEVALAIRYAVDNGAEIINMSWGKYLSSHVDWVRDAFKYAEDNDVLLVSGSGNGAKNTDIELNYPNDNIDGVEFVDNFIMAGGHTHKMDSTLIASFSNYGKNTVDIFAPADKIYAPDIKNDYRFTAGTSFASPLIAGVAALLKSYYPKLSAVELKKIIMDSGTPINIKVDIPKTDGSMELLPFSEFSKTGKIVNAYNALRMAEQISKKSN